MDAHSTRVQCAYETRPDSREIEFGAINHLLTYLQNEMSP